MRLATTLDALTVPGSHTRPTPPRQPNKAAATRERVFKRRAVMAKQAAIVPQPRGPPLTQGMSSTTDGGTQAERVGENPLRLASTLDALTHEGTPQLTETETK